MPRCYMVKKFYQPLTRSPPCSPPEACVAPPCYYPHEEHYTQTDRGRKGGERRIGKKEAESGGNWFKILRADSNDELTDGEVEGHGWKEGQSKKVLKIENTDEAENSNNTKPPEEELKVDMRVNVYDEDANDGFILDMSLNMNDDDETNDRLIVDESKFMDDEEETHDGLVVDESKIVYDNEITQESSVRDGSKHVDESDDTKDGLIIDESKNMNSDESHEYVKPYDGVLVNGGKKEQINFGLKVIEGDNADMNVQLELTVSDGENMVDGEKLHDGEMVGVVEVPNKENGISEDVKMDNINHTEIGGDGGGVKYAELGVTPLSERSAADTEAAHELLSLAAGVPPLPPAAVVAVETEPQTMIPVPLYTYAIPTNIYILAEEPPDPVYHTVQTVSSMPQVNYAAIDPQGNYVTYQEAPLPCTTVAMDYQPIYRECIPQSVVVQPVPMTVMEPIAVPVSVIEQTPVVHPVSIVEPVSVQVPVIEMVPQQQLTPQTSISDSVPYIEVHKVPEERKRRTRIENAGKFDCNECGKRYATSSNLSRHKQTHRSLDSVAAKRCGECGKAYVSMPALAMHVLTHRMGHVCGVCGKQFSRPWLLRGHLRSHTGEKPYRCLSCNKAFADRSNLRAHLQTHSADKKYECQRCNKNFALKSYLSKHQESACVREDDQ